MLPWLPAGVERNVQVLRVQEPGPGPTLDALVMARAPELDRLQQSQRQMDALMDQVKDQQRRTRRLLAVLLNKPQEGSS